MLTQGNARFPTAEQLAMHLETMGAVYGVSIEPDITSVVVSLPLTELPAALDAAIAIATTPTLPEQALRQERRRLASQFRAAWAIPASRSHDLMDRLLYPGTSEGRTAKDLAEAIPSLTAHDLQSVHDSRFRPAGAALALATPGDLTAALDLAEAAVAHWQGSAPAREPAVAGGTKRFAGASMTSDLTYLVMAAPGVPRSHPDLDGLNVMAVTLGGGATSRLFLEVRERRGLCYGIGCRLAAHSAGGVIAIDAGVPTDRLAEALGAINGQIDELAQHATEDEVAKAKALLLGHLAMESDHPATWARRFGRDLVQLNRIRTHQEVIDSISAITVADVRRLAGTYLARNRLFLTVAGPGATTSRSERAFGPVH
jgi:predicted Zn-dependent peptidase